MEKRIITSRGNEPASTTSRRFVFQFPKVDSNPACAVSAAAMLRRLVPHSRQLLFMLKAGKGPPFYPIRITIQLPRSPLFPHHPQWVPFLARTLHSALPLSTRKDIKRPRTFPLLPEAEMKPVEEQPLLMAGSLGSTKFAKHKDKKSKKKKRRKMKKKKKKKKKLEKKGLHNIPCPPSDDNYLKYLLLLALAALIILALLRYFGFLGGKGPKKDYGENYPGLGGPRRRKAKYKHPATAEEFPDSVPYLIVGGGTAGIHAAKGIMEIDSKAEVLIISSENSWPYNRSPLSKELEPKHKDIFFETENYFKPDEALREQKSGVGIARGWPVKKLDLKNKKAFIEGNRSVSYERCLLATGSVPYNMRLFERAKEEVKSRVIVLHDLCDYESLRSSLQEGAQDIVILGSNARACEIAWTLAQSSRKSGVPRVHLVYPQEGLLPDLVPTYLGVWMAKYMQARGVCVIPRAKIRKAEMKEDHLLLRFNTGQKLKACRVIVSAHSGPETQIAKASKLTLDSKLGGFMTNNELRTEAEVWAAGDCMSYCTGEAGRMRSIGIDHAVSSGTVAGRNMARSMDPKTSQHLKCYDHFPMHCGKPCEGVDFESVGNIDPQLPTVGVFASVNQTGGDEATKHTACHKTDMKASAADFTRGVIFYLKKDEVVGLLLWNMKNRLDAARDIIEGGYYYKDLDVAVQQLCFHK